MGYLSTVEDIAKTLGMCQVIYSVGQTRPTVDTRNLLSYKQLSQLPKIEGMFLHSQMGADRFLRALEADITNGVNQNGSQAIQVLTNRISTIPGKVHRWDSAQAAEMRTARLMAGLVLNGIEGVIPDKLMLERLTQANLNPRPFYLTLPTSANARETTLRDLRYRYVWQSNSGPGTKSDFDPEEYYIEEAATSLLIKEINRREQTKGTAPIILYNGSIDGVPGFAYPSQYPVSTNSNHPEAKPFHTALLEVSHLLFEPHYSKRDLHNYGYRNPDYGFAQSAAFPDHRDFIAMTLEQALTTLDAEQFIEV